MTDTEKLEFLIKGLKRIAEQKHCYDENPEYNPPMKELNDDAFDDGVNYGEIYLSRTLLEIIGVEFTYPCMKEK